jgi:UDPglucose 6-dehydrogenase
MRVAFFNEIDSFASIKGLNSKDIIKGISLDNRIGNYYNNPSFGYGGYCLPKDTKQAVRSFDGIKQSIISAIVNSNEYRKNFIVKELINKNEKVVGIYRLAAKQDSDNFRASAILDIIKKLSESGQKIIIYEPIVKQDKIFDIKVINNFNDFVKESDLIVANRQDSLLKKIPSEKIYTKSISDVDI